MSKKHSFAKKIFAVLAISGVVYGIITFFKKFEKEDDDDDFNSFQVPTGYEYDDASENADDAGRNYTTIAGEKKEETSADEKKSTTDTKAPASETTTK